MRLRLPDRGERGERGAIAVMTALLAVVLLAVAALGVDITSQVNELQKLHDTIDAAAHAGAYRLSDSGTARLDALASFRANNVPAATPELVPTVDFFCVVASTFSGGIWIVDTTQIPATCKPSIYAGTKCNSRICSIPCNAAGDVCNTVRVSAKKDVPFSFGPAIGVDKGSTGAVTSVACKGSCGTIPPNPMDVAVVADRTGSMSTADRNAMIAGIKSMFQVMTPSQQYVALGTIGRSVPSGCKSSPSGSETTGPWIPVPFSNDYLTAGASINTGSQLIHALNCLTSSSTGTSLAAPMKSAARFLLDPSNLPSPEVRTGIPRKVLIFETDGQPNESPASGGSTALTTSDDVFSNTDATWNVGGRCGQKVLLQRRPHRLREHEGRGGQRQGRGCPRRHDRLQPQAARTATSMTRRTPPAAPRTASRHGRPAPTSKYAPPTKVTDALAASASPSEATGLPSVAQNTCVSGADQADENTDGDFFFCASSGTDMAAIFKTAFTQAARSGSG